MLEIERDLRILEALESNPELSQAGPAAQLGKGRINVSRLQRRKLRYFVTPKGLALRGQLTVRHMKAPLCVYRELRHSARQALERPRASGYGAVRVAGLSEANDILRLTCIEMGMSVEAGAAVDVPLVRLEGERCAVLRPGGEDGTVVGEV